MDLQRAESRSRMFQVGGKPMKTWNVWVGCDYLCTYCNARQAALTRLRHSPRYKDGFNPHLVESELARKFKPGEFIFIGYMGDISFATKETMWLILSHVRQFPHTRFLIQSKNPACFHYWSLHFPPNVYLGTTLETNRDYKLSKAPPPIVRYRSLRAYPHRHKFISIEPVCDFDLDEMLSWMAEIKPQIIEVGADNYHNDLPEPSWEKIEKLLEGLENICPTVVRKVGLERLAQ